MSKKRKNSKRQQTRTDRSEEKRAAVLDAGPKNRAGSSSGIQSSSKQISFPTNIFEDGRARYFKYDSPDGLSIRYFILKSSDGIIRAAFDACDVCWRERKGYHQEGDVMVCNNCGQRFPSVKVNEIKGGCNPSPLNRKLVGNKVIIKVADILEGGNLYFNFGRGGRRG